MILESKLLTGLLKDRCYLGVVRLNHSGEEMVCGLMVECSSEDGPEPAVGGIVLCGSHLHLSPGD